MKVLSNHDYAHNQIMNVVVHVLASAPGSPSAGQIYYDSTLHQLGYYNGSTWIYGASVTFGSVTAQTTFGASSGDGVASTSARSDHTHGTPGASAFSSIPLSALGTATATINLGGFRATNAADPTSAQDLATMNYVLAVAQGAPPKGSVQAATTTALANGPAVYASVSNGVGDTLTAASNGAWTGVDGVALWTALSSTISAMTNVGTTVTATVPSNAGMAVGQPVNITNAAGLTNVNGDWTVASLVGSTQFTFVVGTTPTGSYTASSATAQANAARILVKNEATAANNGIYTVTALGTASTKYVLTRATDMDSALNPDTNTPKYDGATVYVEEGTVNGTTSWSCTNTGGVVPGTTSIAFTQYAGPGTYTAGTGLTLSGNQFSLTTPVSVANGGTGSGTAAGARTSIGAVGKFASTVNTTGGTPLTINHNLGTQDVSVTVWDAASAGNMVMVDVTNTDANNLTITTAASQTGLRVVVMG